MARSLVLLSFIFIVVVASIHARSIEHHIRTRAVCPAGMCLSKFGYCGDTIDYCGEGCQGGACYGGPCPPGMCLSQHGFCGTTDAYCGVGCRAGLCQGGAITLPPVVTASVPSIVNITLPSGISSGPCPAGMCLSKFGYCGDTVDHCGADCQAGACYGGPCPPGMCLSQHGFCGTTDAYCGVGCRAGPCYGGAITLPPVVTVTVPSVANTTLPPIVTDTLPPIVTDILPPIVTDILPPIVTDTLPPIVTDILPPIVTDTLPSGADDHSGDGTFYDPGLGACGFMNSGTDFVAAIAAPDFDPNTPNGNPNRNSLCDRRILVTGPKGTITVIAADRCPVCKSGDLDLSPAAFDQIADQSAGRVPITWHFI